jgi:LPS sulfotransferase NodH
VGRVTRGLKAWGPRPLHRWLAPERRFLILTTGRSGGELLASLLDSHPSIMCDGELLLHRTALPHQVVRGREALAGLRRAQAYGFKLTRENLVRQELDDPAEFVRVLHARGYRMIVLERRDLLQQAISFARAEKLGYLHHRAGGGGEFVRLALDPMAVLALMYVIEEAARFCHEALAGIPHLLITYEEDLATPERQQRAVDEICRSLGLPPAVVHSDLVRVTPEAIEDQIENPEELLRVLSVTRYARYIPDAVAPERP